MPKSALDKLSPDAQAKIIAILQSHPRLNQDLLADMAPGENQDRAIFLLAATWPDMIRFPLNPMRSTEHHARWHYVDYPYELDGVQYPQPVVTWNGKSDPANLIQAMDKVQKDLRDPQTPKDRKAIDLCWVEHLVGDIHQPLHAANLYSKEYPTGDLGGNLVFIRTGTGLVMPLHTYWDDVEGLSLDPADIRTTADRIEKEHPEDEFKDHMKNGDVVAWAMESFELAKQKAYLNGTLPHDTKEQSMDDPNSVPSLPAGYEKEALAVADVRIAQAGYRLAAMLEDLAKSL